MNINTVDCINNTDNLKQLLDFVETRKVIIPVENFLYKPQVLKEALQFEKLYILTKQDYYSRRMREEINRLTDLEGRV